ncbi:unnamed protein product, partial [Brassica napus]
PPENNESGGKRSERLNHVVPAHLERRSQWRTVDGVRDDESTNRSDEDNGETELILTYLSPTRHGTVSVMR